MLVSEYVNASFDDVCRALQDLDLSSRAGGRSPATADAGGPALRATFRTATSAAFEWAECPSGTAGRTLRVLMVQSGVRPLTELIVVSEGEPAAVRAFVAAVAATLVARIGSPAG